MTFPRLRALLLMLRGHMVKPDPTVPPVDRPGDVHSRKVAPTKAEREWVWAQKMLARGEFHAAAECLIAATGNGEARIVEEDA